MIESVNISIALWVAFALSAAFITAHYEDMIYFYKSRGHRDLHPFYVILRGIALAGLFCFVWKDLNYIQLGIFVLGMAAIFPFFYDGNLYRTRNKLDPAEYEKGWWSNKKKDSPRQNDAKMNLQVSLRIFFLIVGSTFLIGMQIFQDWYL